MSSTSPAATTPPAEARFGAYDTVLYAVTVFGWSTSWIAMKAQVGVVAPEVSLLWRFLIAAAAMWIWVWARGDRLIFPWRHQIGFAGLGAFLFSTNFTLFYYGSASLPSGLLSVVFSLASIGNLALGVVFFRQKLSGQVLIGGTLGFAGVVAMFSDKILGSGFSHAALIGLGLCIAGTTFFCIGNQISGAVQRRGIPVLVASAWGMSWACLFLACGAVLHGSPFVFLPTLGYTASLLWLAVVSSVLAFWAYLTLLGRIGAARAGYSTVMFPVFALLISTVWEGYHWTPAAFVGLALVMAGNLFVLRRR
jgi:drug/metabolite transporter (DMT)-like permease